MTAQEGKKRINGYYVEGEGTPGRHRLNITRDKRWFIEYDSIHGKPVAVKSGRPKGPTHSIRLGRGVDLIEYRLCDVADFLDNGSTNCNHPDGGSNSNVGDEDYDDWIGDPTSRGIGC